MVRVLVLVALFFALAFGAVWLADRPGDVIITWQGYRIETSVGVGLVGVVLAAIALALLWSIVRFVFRLPSLMTIGSRARRRAKGYAAVSRGMVAVGAGDPAGAKRFSAEARRLIGQEPLTLLLDAQTAQLAGDRPAAEAAFRKMVEEDSTKVLGLRGLFIEARRRHDSDEAFAFAQEAVRLAPAASWANEAVLTETCARGDWAAARAALERSERLRVIDKETGKRQRAVLLTAEAMALGPAERKQALALALDANRLAPDLVPAAALAGRLLGSEGELRKAARILEASWKRTPHPDLAEAYVDLRAGDSTRDRLERARTLAKLKPDDPESHHVVAQAALGAQDFAAARESLAPLIESQPTSRVCLLMAEVEEAEFGARGRVQAWLARAARAPRDKAWVADGFVSDRWAPVSPITGRLDAFVWMIPPQRLSAPADLNADDVLADFHEAAVHQPLAIAAEPAEPEEERPAPAIVDSKLAEPTEEDAEPSSHKPSAAVSAGDKPVAMASPPLPVVFPVPHPPDDPGAQDPAGEPEPDRRGRLLG